MAHASSANTSGLLLLHADRNAECAGVIHQTPRPRRSIAIARTLHAHRPRSRTPAVRWTGPDVQGRPLQTADVQCPPWSGRWSIVRTPSAERGVVGPEA